MTSKRKEKDSDHFFFGKKIVFNGDLSITRAKAKALAHARGARVVSSISRDVDILVAGSGGRSCSKLISQAELQGVEIWDDETFVAYAGFHATTRSNSCTSPDVTAFAGVKRARRKTSENPVTIPSSPTNGHPSSRSDQQTHQAPQMGVVNPVSDLESKGTVLSHLKGVYDADLALKHPESNSNKFCRIQIVESHDRSIYWLVSHWGLVGNCGHWKSTEFKTKEESIKKFKKESSQKSASRIYLASTNATMCHTSTEERVAASGGRIADEESICFCLSWDAKGVDLDIHCKLPTQTRPKKHVNEISYPEEYCLFSNKKPRSWITLDVDKMGHHYPNQVENIILTAKLADDGLYEYCVRCFSGSSKVKNGLGFKFSFNQFGKVIHEGKGIMSQNQDITCVKLNMYMGEVESVTFDSGVDVSNISIGQEATKEKTLMEKLGKKADIKEEELIKVEEDGNCQLIAQL